MTFAEAEKILGVKRGSTTNAVQIAFRSAVRMAHPDVGGSGGSVTRIVEAKDLLMKMASDFEPSEGDDDCPRCKGKGTVKGITRFGAQCSACNGSGKNANLHRYR